MRPVDFAYLRPDSLADAVTALHEGQGRARTLAGGQSLVQLLNRRAVRPSTVVDVTRLTGLRHLTRDGDALRIGALTRHRDLETTTDPAVVPDFAVLKDSARLVAFAPIRSRGTFGGSIAHADPCSEWCLLALALDATITAIGPDGERTVEVDGFFLGGHRTRLAFDEIVTEVRIPRPRPRTVLREFSIRRGDYALVAAAASLERGPGPTVTHARVALGGVADRPVRLAPVEDLLVGAVPDDALLRRVARTVADAVDPPGDVHAGPEYRRHLAATLTVQVLREAWNKGDLP